MKKIVAVRDAVVLYLGFAFLAMMEHWRHERYYAEERKARFRL